MTAQITHIRTAAETALTESYRAHRDTLPGGAEMRGLRDAAFNAFAESGLPHRRIESWHYTDLRAAMREARPLAERPAPEMEASVAAALSASRMEGAFHVLLLDGHHAPRFSEPDTLPAGVSVESMTEALARTGSDVTSRLGRLQTVQGDGAFGLNAAFMQDGVVVRVAPGVVVEAPLVILHMRSEGAATASYTRSLVEVGAGASVTVIERFDVMGGSRTPASPQLNDAIEFVVGDGASVEHDVLQTLPQSALQLSTFTADLGTRATLNSFALVLGGGLTRRQSFVRYSGEHAFAGLRGAALLNGRQHADTTLVMDHAVPNGTSRELFKHVLDGAATGVYQGKVIVRQHAQKTDGGMKSNALLLSDDATMNNKPELEIFADDVVCGHGATCGALDDEMLFYIMARGLPRLEAERLLIQAFVGEAVEFVAGEAVRDMVTEHVETWLAAR